MDSCSCTLTATDGNQSAVEGVSSISFPLTPKGVSGGTSNSTKSLMGTDNDNQQTCNLSAGNQTLNCTCDSIQLPSYDTNTGTYDNNEEINIEACSCTLSETEGNTVKSNKLTLSVE